VSQREGTGYVSNYLYDFADLLIVDEAGQAAPEVAGASFAVAKKALVIGDTLQIEPIASIAQPVDIGNLSSAGLIGKQNEDDAYEQLSRTGKTVATGSVMRIAQCASRYHYAPELDRGLFLFEHRRCEHRRCVDEIISYCNTLCYQGKLIPRRGPKTHTAHGDGLPAVGYLHIDGLCRNAVGGSRENLLEAEMVAAWLASNRSMLESHYGAPLHEIVGVVTPFSAQVRAIAAACAKMNIATGGQANEMTVGTVHSLQGAERPVVIFSGVYSKHADGGFIDRSPSMLNVAVSRAKNTFLFFGDMDVLELAPPDSPRGQLAACLFRDDRNALRFEHRPRTDLAPETGVTQLRDAPEHDGFLADLLARAAREVHIVTPWIRLACVEETGALTAMAAAVRRGVKVHVYTDQDSNTVASDASARERKWQEFREAMDALSGVGIEGNAVRKVHSKIVIGDDDVYCVGSFNWFSAKRDHDARHETSLVYRGAGLAAEKAVMKESLRQRSALRRTS